MDHDANHSFALQPQSGGDTAVITPAEGDMLTKPTVGEMPCPTCASTDAALSFFYAICQVEARFSRLRVEKEFAQATVRAYTA